MIFITNTTELVWVENVSKSNLEIRKRGKGSEEGDLNLKTYNPQYMVRIASYLIRTNKQKLGVRFKAFAIVNNIIVFIYTISIPVYVQEIKKID